MGRMLGLGKESFGVTMSKAEKKQLENIARHYGMTKCDVVRTLIKREALRIAKHAQ